jgi:hypothetical protein
MSEYPCTGIDKAILKFVLQDRKISQIVSVKISVFFLSFVRKLLPECVLERHFTGVSVRQCRPSREVSYEAYAAPRDGILTQNLM